MIGFDATAVPGAATGTRVPAARPCATVARTLDVGGTDTGNRRGFGAMRPCGPDILDEPDGATTDDEMARLT